MDHRDTNGRRRRDARGARRGSPDAVAHPFVAWFRAAGDPTGPESDLTAVVYSWLRSAAGDESTAADLTVDTFRRARESQPDWLSRHPIAIRARVLAVQALVEHRRLRR